MEESAQFGLETQRELSSILDATQNRISEACDNMHILEEARRRVDARVKELAEELKRAKLGARRAQSRVQGADEREQSPRLQLDRRTRQLQKQETEHARVASELSSALKDIDRLRSRLNRVTAERDVSAAGAGDCDGIRRDNHSLQRQLAKAAASLSAQQKANAGQKELNNPRAENAALKEALEAEKAGAAALNKQLAGAGHVARTHEIQRAELDETLEIRKALDEELSCAREHLARSAEEKTLLKQELVETRQVMEGQKAQLAAAEELRDALQLDLDVSRGAISELKQTLSDPMGQVCYEEVSQA